MRLLIAAFLFISFNSSAQSEQPDWTALMNEPNANFFEIEQQFYDYWEGRERERGDGYKPVMRWMENAKKHLNEDGTIRSAADYLRVWEEAEEYKASRSLEGNWQELGPILDEATTRDDIPGIGRINTIAFHPNDSEIIFAGAPSGGFWKTTNGGDWWVNLTDNLPTLGVSAIVINPNNPNEIYIGTGDRDGGDAPGLGVWKTIDGGETWIDPNFSIPNLVIGMMVINPNDPSIVLAATNAGVYRTTNSGDSWALVSPTSNFKDIKLHPTNPDIVYATGSTSFYRSENGGATFSSVSGNVSFSSRSVIGVCPQEPDLVYVCGANTTSFRAFFRSNDAGVSWEEVSNSPNILGWSDDSSGGQAWYDFCMAVNPENPLDVTVGGIRVSRSLDGGVTWNEITNNFVHVDQHFCEFHPETNNFWLGNDGGVYEFFNENGVWEDRTNGMVISQMYKLGQSPFNVNQCLTGFQDNGTSEWNGTKWERRVGADGMECMYDHQDPDYFYGAIQYGQVRRTGPEYTAQTCANQGFNGITEGGSWVTPYTLDLENSNTMYLGYVNLWKCDNIKDPEIENVQWEKVSDNLLNNDGANVNDICQHPANPSTIYISKQTRKLFRKDDINDSETEWVNLSTNLPPINLTVDDVEAHPFDENIIYIAFYREIYKSVNRGEDWEQITNENFPDIGINSIVYDRNSDEGLYIGTEMGVYYKDATMEDWIPFSGGNMPGALDVRELEIFYGEDISDTRLRAATYGRGLWESDLYDSETYYFPAKATIILDNEGEVFGEFEADIRFYKNLNYVDAETLEIDEIQVTNGTVTSISGGPNTYTVTIMPDTFGEVTIYIPDGVAEDSSNTTTEESVLISLAYNSIPEPLGIYGPGGVGSLDQLSYWFMAGNGLLNTPNGVTPADMSPFGYWEDVTGNGSIAMQDNPSAQPLYLESSDLFNGQPAILFTEDSTFLRTNEVSITEDIAAFCVASAENNPNAYTLWNEHGWLASAREPNGFIIHPWKDAFKVTGMIYDNQENETQGLNTIFVPSINSATIHGMSYYNNSANKFLDSYVNGNLDRVQTNDVERDASDLIQVNFGRDFGDRYGRGLMAEQILYTERLYNVHTLLVRNYLASKYASNCDGLDRYTQDNLYYHEVAGIGQLSEFDKHLDAQGPGIVRMNAATDMDNNEFLLWGHSNGLLQWAWGDPVFNSGRLARVWGYEETGDVGTVTVRIEDSAVMNVVEGIGLIWDEVPTFESSTAPNFEPLELIDGMWTAQIDFTGKGVFTVGIAPVLGIEEVNAEFKLFPNPASSEVTLDFTKLDQVTGIEILNALGQVVLLEAVSSQVTTLDISSLPSGNYFVRVKRLEVILHTEKLEVIQD